MSLPVLLKLISANKTLGYTYALFTQTLLNFGEYELCMNITS